jgi:hypothetical protein
MSGGLLGVALELYALAVPPASCAFCGVRPIAIGLPALQALMRLWTQEAFI